MQYRPRPYHGQQLRPTGSAPHRTFRGKMGAVPRPISLRVLRERIQWTLVFSAFFAFSGGVIASRLTVGQPIMILGLIGVALQTVPLRFGPVPALLAIWTLWGVLGYFVTPYPDAVIDAVTQLAKLCLIAVVGVNALRTRGQIRAYCVFLLFAFLLYPGRGTFLNWITGANLSLGGRAIWNGVYANPNDLAGISLLVLSIALAVSAGEVNRRYKLAALVMAGFLAFVIFITQSRGALIALGIFLIVVLRQMPKSQRVRATMVAAALGAVVVVFAPSSVWDRLSGLKNVTNTEDLAQVDAEGSAKQRFEIWKVARTIIAEHPLTGVGIGAYPLEHGNVAMRPQFNPIARGNRDTHSMYFNVLAETGIPGFLIFATLILVTVQYVNRVRRRAALLLPQQSLQLLFLLVGLLAFCVAAIWASYAKLNLLYLQLVLMWATAKVTERDLAQILRSQPTRVR